MLLNPSARQFFKYAALAALSCVTLHAERRVVDFRYGIPTWHLPLGIPDDWHKPMGNERGALLYDFGPGPYVQPMTTVEFGAEGDAFALVQQEWLESPRQPILRTQLRRGEEVMEVTTLSLPPERPANSDGKAERYERLDGITGSLGWARPAGNASPEFRNVAWGINRPLRYRVKVEPGAAKRVMLGFCESYKLRIGDRLADMNVEGAAPLLLDIALNAPLNQPQVFLFDGADTDRNGWLDVSIIAPQGHDPNTTLATIAVFPAGLRVTRDELVAGANAKPDRAELRIACGTEMRRQSPRVDFVHASYSGRGKPVLTVKTGRELSFGDDGILRDGDVPFVSTTPRASSASRTAAGWKLVFPDGTTEATARVHSGAAADAEVNAAAGTSIARALEQTRNRWREIAVPQGRITVADPAIQEMVDTSIRVLYQSRETIGGQTQFNSSFSLYRGLWAGDAVYVIKLAAMLGDSPAGRSTLDALFSHQNAEGIIDELHPQKIFRTTAEVLWAVERDAQISGDWSYARKKWPQILRAVDGIRGLREKTLLTPDAPYAGMLPPGFSDGGILDIGAEYSSVQCTITGLNATVRTARALGDERKALEIKQLADEFQAAFDRNRRRDQRRDANGNPYLPVRVGFKGEDPIPQLTQWAYLDSILHGSWLAADDAQANGTLRLLESVEKQGIPVSLGWMPGGNWAGMGMFYAQAQLVRGRHAKAADLLYASANHASALGTWVEEQSLVGQPLKLAGDQPHCFASAMLPQLVGSMLAHDHGENLHLLSSIPAEWLGAGAVNRLDGWHTMHGVVTLALAVSPDGKTATLDVEPIKYRGNGRILVHTASLADAGFVAAQDVRGKAETIEVSPGKKARLRFAK